MAGSIVDASDHHMDNGVDPDEKDSFTKLEPQYPSTTDARKLIIVLENASLEASQVHPYKSDKVQLLNCDDHQALLKRLNRDIAEARPDIVHQCLLTLMDSPLNKSGHLQVYIHTAKDVLIRINPECRIPRTFKRFSGLMVQLLQKQSIVSMTGADKLLELVPGPVSRYLPENSKKIAMSWDAPKVRLYPYFKKLSPERTLCVAIGAMAKGQDDFADSYVDEKIGVSDYALSASVACGKVCCALEDVWGIM